LTPFYQFDMKTTPHKVECRLNHRYLETNNQ
jgi:hypothetical protein